jgi:hypothetical protein
LCAEGQNGKRAEEQKIEILSEQAGQIRVEVILLRELLDM